MTTDTYFIGIWFTLDNEDWIEFRKDKKYDVGAQDRILESGDWEINATDKTLIFRSENPTDSRKYKYVFEGPQLILYTIQGEEKLRLEKR